ncbi:MAG: hypothetical protein L0K70_03730, partial [Bifidobacterium crudilactis]|nr:hypothetical protein [Bifidobacterium crudilactis]
YSEQVGRYLQRGGNSGETDFLYQRIALITALLTYPVIGSAPVNRHPAERGPWLIAEYGVQSR